MRKHIEKHIKNIWIITWQDDDVYVSAEDMNVETEVIETDVQTAAGTARYVCMYAYTCVCMRRQARRHGCL